MIAWVPSNSSTDRAISIRGGYVYDGEEGGFGDNPVLSPRAGSHRALPVCWMFVCLVEVCTEGLCKGMDGGDGGWDSGWGGHWTEQRCMGQERGTQMTRPRTQVGNVRLNKSQCGRAGSSDTFPILQPPGSWYCYLPSCLCWHWPCVQGDAGAPCSIGPGCNCDPYSYSPGVRAKVLLPD